MDSSNNSSKAALRSVTSASASSFVSRLTYFLMYSEATAYVKPLDSLLTLEAQEMSLENEGTNVASDLSQWDKVCTCLSGQSAQRVMS